MGTHFEGLGEHDKANQLRKHEEQKKQMQEQQVMDQEQMDLMKKLEDPQVKEIMKDPRVQNF